MLFAIVFFWQMPHVLAISWMYREDYERGGIRVLPVEEPDGAQHGAPGRHLRRGAHPGQPAADDRRPVGRRSTSRGALVLGLAQLVLAVQFARDRTP